VTLILENGRTDANPHQDQGREILKARDEQNFIKSRNKHQRRQQETAEAKIVADLLTVTQRECVLAAQEKGVSSWLGAIPLDRAGFSLHKGAFRDALALRYNWPLKHLPALVCQQGGFHIHRHNRVRDLVASLLGEVCPNVVTEPELQALSGEQLPKSANKEERARLDVRASNFWGLSHQDASSHLRIGAQI